ncbi:MAG: hypothetical protein K0S32_331 [Bacteroidetes bacterium]|jgi:hypothetical protein|nr:hypothetical protein [Bacteroidota bacterium]
MKKLIGFALLASAFFFTSCKKEYVCECKKIYTGNSTTVSQNDGDYAFRDSHARAVSRCNEQETTGTDLVGGNYTRECELK